MYVDPNQGLWKCATGLIRGGSCVSHLFRAQSQSDGVDCQAAVYCSHWRSLLWSVRFHYALLHGMFSKRRVLLLRFERQATRRRSERTEALVPLSQTDHLFAFETTRHSSYGLSRCQRRSAHFLSCREYLCLVGVHFVHRISRCTSSGRISRQDRHSHHVPYRMPFRQRHSSSFVRSDRARGSTSPRSTVQSSWCARFWQWPSYHSTKRNRSTFPTFGAGRCT